MKYFLTLAINKSEKLGKKIFLFINKKNCYGFKILLFITH